jgi:histidine ammonia-lyase
LSEIVIQLLLSRVLTGVGDPLTPERTRMLLALRINILAKGHSGISPKTLHQYIDAFNGKHTD